MASADRRNELICALCLKSCMDPVTLRCDHSFCRVCIDRVLDAQEESGVYTCLECGEEFQELQDSIKHTMPPNIPEGDLSTDSDQEDSGFCTYCIHSPVPAVKLCLFCESFLCEGHMEVHRKSAEHILTDPTTSMKSRKCLIHNEMLRYVCHEDSACICVSCFARGDHRGHQVGSLIDAFELKKDKLRTILKLLISKAELTAKRIQGLQEHRGDVPETFVSVTERVAVLFGDIRGHLDDLEKKVLNEIARQQEQISRSISILIQQLETKKNELSWKICHIEELCKMTDPLTVLRDQESDRVDFCDIDGIDDVSSKGGENTFQDVGDLDEGLISWTLHTGIEDIATHVKKMFDVLGDSNLHIDLSTAGCKIIVSDDLKTATWSASNQNRPEIPDRFQYNQVLSTQGFTSGQHYWEVETSESGNWRLGVAYPTIDRRGHHSVIGDNGKSWCLRKCNNQCSLIHNSKDIFLSDKFTSHRFRICLDYKMGCLSFYELCEPIRHLHTFTATFNEPLHAAFLLSNAWVRIRS